MTSIALAFSFVVNVALVIRLFCRRSRVKYLEREITRINTENANEWQERYKPDIERIPEKRSGSVHPLHPTIQ
jgi:hypothetical protein